MFSAFVARVQPWDLPPPRPGARRAAVVVTPWCSCPLPWFALATACLLRRQGEHVTLLWNDVCDIEDEVTFQRETELIGAFLKHFSSFEIVRLSEQRPAEERPIDPQRLASAARANAIWRNRGSLPRERVAELERSMTALLRRSFPFVAELFARHRFDYAFIPGGMFGNSGLYLDQGRAHGVRMSTYDANTSSVLIGLREAASCCPDIPTCVQQAAQLLGDRRDLAREIARNRLRERMDATEKFFTEPGYVGQPVQMVSAEQDRNSYCDDVVIPLNVEWDTAALGLHRFFRDDCEWLVETVGFLLRETEARVAIRQHPGNRVVVDGAANLEQELARHFGNHPRYRFIRATDPVSTYKLLSAARVVLPYTTTTGIEAAMLGKPLVLESRAYYAGLPFAETFDDKPSYFRRIAEALRQPPPPDAEKIAFAELCYFFAAVCNYVPTQFTPHPDDCTQWSQLSLEALAADEGVKTIITAVINDVPTAAIQSGKRLDAVSPAALPSPVPTRAGAPLRIGVPIIGSKGWQGGVIYIHNLLRALRDTHAGAFQAFLITDDATLNHIPEHQELIDEGLLHGLINVGSTSVRGPASFSCTRVSRWDELGPLIDVMYPGGWAPHFAPNVVCWIPDFQYHHLPHFFPAGELEFRFKHDERIATRARHVVFSSDSARRDFAKLFPRSPAVSHLLRFHSTMPPASFEGEAVAVAARYGCAPDYLICSNQFWTHKNHRVLLAAMRLLSERGFPIQLV
ncbi:MAG TPA: hypothetical protein VNO55_10595, partial [Polyangia bacterium]|nr:hypothetical protein [Polyangia bacterium]